MLSRLVIAFLPRSKCLLGASKDKYLSLFPLFLHLFAMKWWDQKPWSYFSECWVLNQLFQLSSSTFIKRLFSSFSLSAIRMVSSTYLRLLISCFRQVYTFFFLFWVSIVLLWTQLWFDLASVRDMVLLYKSLTLSAFCTLHTTLA